MFISMRYPYNEKVQYVHELLYNAMSNLDLEREI